MSDSISKSERATQERVLRLFTEGLGYRYLGDWSDRAGNHCIEEEWLTAFLARSGYSPAHISAALQKLRSEALLHGRTLYAANQAVYQLLRYGIPVKVAAGQSNESVHLVNWDQPAGNDFAIAEEVTLKGGGTSGHERRPDLVLYLNGIAVGVLELKYFFSRAMISANGSACSGTAIRGLIKDIIEAEHPDAPLSDAEITRQLAAQGLVVARRTVTKYRQMLKIEAVERRRRVA